MIIGGERRTIVTDNEPQYSALYEIESPEVLVTRPGARPWSRDGMVIFDTRDAADRYYARASTCASARA